MMILRDSRVLARCDERGDLQVESGRVEIRYRPTDGKAYRAAERNLSPANDSEIFPDDHCVDAQPVENKKADKKPSRAKKKKKAAAGVLPTSAAPGEVVAYTDGACSGNPGPAGLGVVLLDGEERRELSEYLGTATNNVAELTAILRAAEAIRDPSARVRILTDSQYAIGVLTKGWKAKANKALVADTKAALGRFDNVEVLYVPGHAGVALNERADELAVEAVKSRS
ncbi:MAG: ribonuclease H [Myxococcota bacterium]